jgi:hypothetical protein
MSGIIQMLIGAMYNNIPEFGEAMYINPGSYSFVVPADITTISAVCVGGGSNERTSTTPYYGGMGGALTYTNNIPVTPNETLTVVVGSAPKNPGVSEAGGASYILRGGTTLIYAAGGYLGNAARNASAGIGAVKYSGGFGGDGEGAGGGAAGYAGDGGDAIATNGGGASGAGGGGGAGGSSTNQSGGGGGVGLIVQGPSGLGGASTGDPGFGGSGGGNGGGGNGGLHGGGGGGHGDNTNQTTGKGTGGYGGVRIIFGGVDKSYPLNSAP